HRRAARRPRTSKLSVGDARGPARIRLRARGAGGHRGRVRQLAGGLVDGVVVVIGLVIVICRACLASALVVGRRRSRPREHTLTTQGPSSWRWASLVVRARGAVSPTTHGPRTTEALPQGQRRRGRPPRRQA